jgi:hypothetical protein
MAITQTMKMKYLDATGEVIINSLILSFLAAMIRVFFTKMDNYIIGIKIFAGSLILGVLVGYVGNDLSETIVWLKTWLKIFVIVFSIFGKELYMFCEKFFNDPGKNVGVIVAVYNAFKSIKISFTKEDNKNDVT